MFCLFKFLQIVILSLILANLNRLLALSHPHLVQILDINITSDVRLLN